MTPVGGRRVWGAAAAAPEEAPPADGRGVEVSSDLRIPDPRPMSVTTASLLEGLTEPQQRAVTTTEGPLLVLAAAGSGKTRVITRRIAHLVGMGVPPWQILALTFTNKAAGEMRQRVESLLGGAESRSMRGLTVTTFHSLCARLLRRYADRAGLKPEFSIYDTADQWSLCKRVIDQLEMSTSNWPPRVVLGAVSNAKNELLDAAGYAAQASDFYTKSIAKIYAAYEKALRAAGAVDFDDLLVLTAKLLKEDRATRQELNARWRYILIDEYQDTNRAQFVIASLLAGETHPETRGPNICVVGDPDQAIYGWRGADISNILDFETRYPAAAVITLGENFRSTAPILAAADKLIRNNKRRKHKDLFTSRHGGEKVRATLCRDEQHESTLVADWLRGLHDAREHPVAWREMAVFYRTNALSRVIEESLRGAGIPYTVARGTAFYEREEIKNALAYLRLTANTSDDVSLLRIVNTPTRGIGESSLERIEHAATQNGEPVFALLSRFGRDRTADALAPRASQAVKKFVAMVDGWTGGGTFLGAQVPVSLAELVERVIKESGLEEMYREQARASGSDTDAERLENLSELVSSARQFELEYDPAADPAGDVPGEQEPQSKPPTLLGLLRGFLESIALVADADAVDPSQGAVTLMTLHAAKGLEFTAAAIVGMEEGLLPHARALEAEAQMEEERRLCFVGMTRAMRHLHMTCARYRTIRGVSERSIPSRFFEELDPAHVITADEADALSGLDDAWTGAGSGRSAARTPARGDSGAGGSGAGTGGIRAGMRVQHPQFGAGRVKSVTSGTNARAVVDFESVGTKTLVLEYARLRAVD